jgi:hypothetical protein
MKLIDDANKNVSEEAGDPKVIDLFNEILNSQDKPNERLDKLKNVSKYYPEVRVEDLPGWS